MIVTIEDRNVKFEFEILSQQMLGHYQQLIKENYYQLHCGFMFLKARKVWVDGYVVKDKFGEPTHAIRLNKKTNQWSAVLRREDGWKVKGQVSC